MESIAINWRLRKQRYRLMGYKCPICNITMFALKQVCPNCKYRFDVCPTCGCLYNKKCEYSNDDITNNELGC